MRQSAPSVSIRMMFTFSTPRSDSSSFTGTTSIATSSTNSLNSASFKKCLRITLRSSEDMPRIPSHRSPSTLRIW